MSDEPNFSAIPPDLHPDAKEAWEALDVYTLIGLAAHARVRLANGSSRTGVSRLKVHGRQTNKKLAVAVQ